MKNNWIISRMGAPNVHRIDFVHSVKTSEHWVLLMSDEHFDNAHCRLDVLKRHHEEALERGAPILKFGDTFCAMQGKWDKRADQSHLRDEHRGNNYLDRLVDTAAKFYSPYAANIALIGNGNHEASIMQRHQTCLLSRLQERLRGKGSHVEIGGMWGFVRFSFAHAGKVGGTAAIDLCYHHGYGGGGEITRGLIDNSRTRSQYFADIFYSGHIHRRNQDENIIVALNNAGRITQKQQVFLRGSSYKDEHSPNGWHVATGKASRPIGGWWLKFETYRPHEKGVHVRFSEMRAC
jgi:hypothetical protein